MGLNKRLINVEAGFAGFGIPYAYTPPTGFVGYGDLVANHSFNGAYGTGLGTYGEGIQINASTSNYAAGSVTTTPSSRLYYEVHIISSVYSKPGFFGLSTGPDFTWPPQSTSYYVDGNGYKWSGSTSAGYGLPQWGVAGQVLSILYDQGDISFWLNGTDYGVAYSVSTSLALVPWIGNIGQVATVEVNYFGN